MRFKQKEKLEHYSKVAKGEEKVKPGSKYSEAEQRAYARGQRDARNEANRIYAASHSTEAERAEYRAKQAKERAAYLERQAKNLRK